MNEGTPPLFPLKDMGTQGHKEAEAAGEQVEGTLPMQTGPAVLSAVSDEISIFLR